MKINAAFAKSLLLIASFGLVVPIFAKPPAKPVPAKQEETAKAEGDEADIVIPGTVVTRKDGSFISITVENNCFKMAFYNAKKKQVPADVARANVHWNPKNKKNEERRVLNASGDGLTLISTPPVQAPHAFKIYCNLLNENGDAVESFNTDFHD
jgi:hypothetical protein